MTNHKPVLSEIQLRELALAALVDDRTFKRALRGERIRALGRERIVRVLTERNLLDLLPQEASAR